MQSRRQPQFPDFDTWNKLKQSIHALQSTPSCKTGDVWWCAIGKNIGTEQSSSDELFSRPVLIVTVWRNNFLGFPITSSTPENKKHSPFYFDLNEVPHLRGFVCLTQIRIFDNRRLMRKITKLEKEILARISLKFKDFLP